MDALPDEVLSHVFSRITSTADRNSLALSCKRCHHVERLQRWSLRLGCGLHPVDEALVRLCKRFSNLVGVEISYLGWMSNQGRQLDDQGLALLSENCRLLTTLKLSYCCFITDTGLGNLGRSSNLEVLTLNFIPRISGARAGSLHACPQWLEHLGAEGRLENLFIRNCRGVGELDLAGLGWGWSSLRRLVFEVDGSNYRFLKEFGNAGVCGIDVNSESLQLLVLTNCVVTPRRGLSSVLARCSSALVDLELNMCLGLRDEQLIALAETCSQLKSLTLRLSSLFEGSTRITDASFCALATHCVFLEKACIGFSSGEFHFVTVAGLALVIQGCCFLKDLVLENVGCFNDEGMEAVCSSGSLETLELVVCCQVGDKGISGLACSKLRKLRLCRCSGITGTGFNSLAGRSPKLNVLEVENCPRVVIDSLEGVASTLRYKQS
ncbi:hypothetical protein SELMODRAFT_417324 [Selaginella moellendorffii]|uniref:COI1 F-box domain-containing protein n=1 Tax=Selaginella moellendorffii TaxID=88036 RepID=D8S1V8_SELML|nr:hypothetical protein SELMODRAFT_417324 [Selaginella moellendorffii]